MDEDEIFLQKLRFASKLQPRLRAESVEVVGRFEERTGEMVRGFIYLLR